MKSKCFSADSASIREGQRGRRPLSRCSRGLRGRQGFRQRRKDSPRPLEQSRGRCQDSQGEQEHGGSQACRQVSVDAEVIDVTAVAIFVLLLRNRKVLLDQAFMWFLLTVAVTISATVNVVVPAVVKANVNISGLVKLICCCSV